MSDDILQAERLLECIFGAGALAIGCYCVLQHALTLVYRPSTTLSSWNTVALGHGLAASFCLLLAAPLLGLLLDGVTVRLGELVLEIAGWLPAAIILASVLLLYTVCGAVRSVLTCGAGARGQRLLRSTSKTTRRYAITLQGSVTRSPTSTVLVWHSPRRGACTAAWPKCPLLAVAHSLGPWGEPSPLSC